MAGQGGCALAWGCRVWESGKHLMKGTARVTSRCAALARAIVLSTASLGLAVAFVAPSGLPAAADPPLTVAEAKAQIEQLETDAAAIDQEYVGVEEQLDRGKAKLELKQADVKAQTDRVAKLKFQVGQVALAHFQNRESRHRRTAVRHPGHREFLSQISTVEKVSENQNSALQDYQQQQAALADLELSAEADLAALSRSGETAQVAAGGVEEEDRRVEVRPGSTQRRRAAPDRRRGATRQERGSAGRGGRPRKPRTSRGATSDNDVTPVASSGSGQGREGAGLRQTPAGQALPVRRLRAQRIRLLRTDRRGLALGRGQPAPLVLGPVPASAAPSPGPICAPGTWCSSTVPISHVALYAGNNTIIHAPRPGKSVEYTKMSYMPYAGARRPG